jgi:DNA-binding CsgD family transcriptional regulator
MLSLIREVYTAAADETRWTTVLERLADEYRGGVAGFQYRTGTEGKVRAARFVRLDPVLQEATRTHFATRNPWTRLSQPLYHTGYVYTPERTLPLSALQRTEFYDGILRPAGVVHCFGACVFKRGDDVLSFTVVRSKTRGPYEDSELEPVRAILPHIGRVVQINERLSDLQRTRASLIDGLDSLRHGVIVVNRSGRVVFANRAARAIVALRDGLSIDADGLIASARDDRLKLRALLDDAVRTAIGDGMGAGGAMMVSRPSMKRPFRVVVAPLTLVPDHAPSPGMATAFISDPDIGVETIEEVTRRLYGLTAAEARAASVFASSEGLDEAADTLHVSRETMRWHLRHIYRKTGTHRQAALLKRLVDGPARVYTRPRQ